MDCALALPPGANVITLSSRGYALCYLHQHDNPADNDGIFPYFCVVSHFVGCTYRCFDCVAVFYGHSSHILKQLAFSKQCQPGFCVQVPYPSTVLPPLSSVLEGLH